MAASEAVIETRRLTELEDLREVVNLQQEIWGFADAELLPLRFFVVASRVGGHVLGAYDGSKLIAFCLGIPGHKDFASYPKPALPSRDREGAVCQTPAEPAPTPYIHSHMLGVRPEYQNLGLGRRLKLEQRDIALAAGIKLIEWTFDPLELKNAFFNIERLGAIVRRYAPNNYGLTASPLHGGLPTDRCYAEWWIDSARVQSLLKDPSVKPPYPPYLRGKDELPAPQIAIAYPANIAQIRSENQSQAREIQQNNAEAFQKAFTAGFAVTHFLRADTQGIYLLEPTPQGPLP